ncbi:MAG: hypothetical protein AAGD07_12230 [Planctomycetota bacterium]
MNLSLAALVLFGGTRVAAQERVPAVVVAIDQPTADLWRLHFPNSRMIVVVLRDDESFDVISQRALLACAATSVLYRSDRCSRVSRFFRDRILNQGVPAIDLAKRLGLRGLPRPKGEHHAPLRVAFDGPDLLAASRS